MWHRAGVALGVALGVAGCSVESVPAAPIVEIGIGRDSFESLVSDGDIELVAGPQGGWHVDLSVRLHRLAVVDVPLTFRTRDPDSQREIGYPFRTFLTPAGVTELGGDAYERVGDRVVLIVEAPSEIVGRALVAEVEAVVDGVVLRDARRVWVIDEEP